jgi:putative ABC transport system substrate-binding protein
MRQIAPTLAVAVALCVAALVPSSVDAQRADKVPRIGYLSPGSGQMNYDQGFLEGLRERGYVEGRNIVIEFRIAAGKNERLPDLASNLVRAGVDVIVTGGTPATMAAMAATRTIPIVFTTAGDPAEKGIVASLAHPGGNVTGLALVTDKSKLVQLLKEVVPQVTRLAFIYDPANYPSAYREAYLGRLADDASAQGVIVQPVALRDPDDTELAFQQIAAGTNALLIDNVNVALMARDRICAYAGQQRLPAIGARREFADAGCLMTYSEDWVDMHRRAAGYVDKILKGARPADLPVEQPVRFDFVVNLKAARALGIAPPLATLLRATEVID